MRIGLTGGIACGKSTVLTLFKERGWHTVSTDALARELLENDVEVVDAVCSHFNDRGVCDVGRIDRAALAAIVFSEDEELVWLEGLLHPRIHARWRAGLPEHGNAMVEIPLLFERDLAAHFDQTLCVEASPDVVTARLQARGYSEAQAEARCRHQWPLARKVEAADVVLSNSGTLAALAAQVDVLAARWSRVAAETTSVGAP